MKLATSRGLSQESGRRLLLTSLTIRREHLKGVLQEYGSKECGAAKPWDRHASGNELKRGLNAMNLRIMAVCAVLCCGRCICWADDKVDGNIIAVTTNVLGADVSEKSFEWLHAQFARQLITAGHVSKLCEGKNLYASPSASRTEQTVALICRAAMVIPARGDWL